MSEQIWTQQQRENTMRQLAQKMSHLTSRPYADLIKLATSLEDMAFNKAAGSQTEYITILSKRMKKLETQFTGQQTPPASQASSFAPVAQQPQPYQQPQAMAQRQHQLFMQQQQQLQQQQLQQQQLQQQQLAAQQQQQMHIQKSRLQQQQQQQQQQAQSMHLPQQSMAMSAGSHEEDFANMADMFGLYNSASSASSQQPANQAYIQNHAQRLQKQQHALMPQIPRQVLNTDQLQQQQQQQILQQQQRQQQMRQQQAQQHQARQLQQQQLRQQQQQQQQQQAQQPATGYIPQSQQPASWQQPSLSSAQLQASQHPQDVQSQVDKEANQARIAQFWEIQGQLRQRYLPQLQALKDSPFMRSHHISTPTREYIARATNISLLRRDDPMSLAAVGTTMTESKLASIRKLCQELEGRLKAVKVAIVKLQEEMARTANAQRAQSQTPPPSLGTAPPPHGLPPAVNLPRPSTPKAAATSMPGPDTTGAVSESANLLPDPTPPAGPTPTLTPAHPLPSAAAPVSQAAAAAGSSQPGQPQLPSVTADLQGANMAGALSPQTHMQTDNAQLPALSVQAAPSLISAITQVGGTPQAAGGVPPSILEEGHVFMPPLSAELQAELASSASSSFNGIATFGIMQQQLSSTFDNAAPLLAGDLAADLLSSPGFAVSDQEMNGGSGGGFSASEEAAAAASVAAVNAAVSSQLSPGMNTTAFNAAAGAAISRSQTAPPLALLEMSLPETPTMLSTLASTAFAEEAGTDPNSPASATTAHVGASHQKSGKAFEAREAHSSQSAPCLAGLGKRRASESNIATQMDVKRSRAHLAHVEAAIKQARETYKGVARLEATDSIYSHDSIMLTCTPMADTATADSADTWQVVTLRISSSYPQEPPSVVVRMSRDAQLAPQGEAVRSVLETSLSTLPFPPTLEAILRCWLSAVESVDKVFSLPQHSASQASLQTPGYGQLAAFSQPTSFPMQGLLPTAPPAVISIGSLAPLSNPAVTPLGNGFSTLSTSAATAGPSFSTLAATSSATGATFGGSGIPQIPKAHHRSLQKQLSTGTMHSNSMLGTIQPGMGIASILPTVTAPVSYSASRAASNPMGSIESLVSAGLLPQGSMSSTQALPQASLGHLAALLDLPRSSALGAASHMPATGLQ